MTAVTTKDPAARLATSPPDGTRRIIDGVERVHHGGYWIRTYAVPPNRLVAKKQLLEALTRRLFKHTEHGLNIPGHRLAEARLALEKESDPARRRVKGAMLAGALFNRAADIFRHLVDMQTDGVEIATDNELMRECGQILLEAMALGQTVLHRSGEEGIDELWGEPFRAFSIPLEDFYESRYVKISLAMRDVDRIGSAIIANLGRVSHFRGIEASVQEFTRRARAKTETLWADPDIFDVWTNLVTAGERLVQHRHVGPKHAAAESFGAPHSLEDGLQLLRSGRDLAVYIVRARTSMPKSTREFVERCESYLATGRVPGAGFPTAY